MILSWLGSILGIFLVDLVLSGDNAIVIGVTASQLPRHQRRTAIILGGGGAIILRITFALAATILLQLRFIGLAGGVVLLFIAIRLLLERSKEQRSNSNESSPDTTSPSNENQPQAEPSPRETERRVKNRTNNSLLVSIITIVLADVTMSLDNVLAIGGIAGGNILPLIIGLIFSVIFLLIGSTIVAELSTHLPLLLDLACLIVAWTAAQIFLGDDVLNDLLLSFPWITPVTYAFTLIIVLISDILLRIRDRQYALYK